MASWYVTYRLNQRRVGRVKILSSIVTASFQLWLVCREDQRKQPIAPSASVGGWLVYQARASMLGFAFAAVLGFLLTNRLIRILTNRSPGL